MIGTTHEISTACVDGAPSVTALGLSSSQQREIERAIAKAKRKPRTELDEWFRRAFYKAQARDKWSDEKKRQWRNAAKRDKSKSAAPRLERIQDNRVSAPDDTHMSATDSGTGGYRLPEHEPANRRTTGSASEKAGAARRAPMVGVRTLILEYLDRHGACHIGELHIEILERRPGTPEHTVRARLSEAVSDGLLSRLGAGFYDLYAEEVGMTSVVSYPQRCSAWGNSRYRGNCDGRLFKNLVLRYGARRVADPMVGSGTTRDVVAGLNRYKRAGIAFWGGDLREGFDLTKQSLPGRFDFCWIHPPYWNIVRYSTDNRDLSSCGDYERFRELLMLCLRRCYDALLPGGRLAVLIGDVRRAGRYTALVRDVLNFPHGELRSIIIKVQHNCTSDRKRYGKLEDPPIKHEYCVVFRKPQGERDAPQQRGRPSTASQRAVLGVAD